MSPWKKIERGLWGVWGAKPPRKILQFFTCVCGFLYEKSHLWNLQKGVVLLTETQDGVRGGGQLLHKDGKCAFFSKNWWFSVKKLRLSTIEIWKKAHLRTVHDKKFSSWEIYYIYVRECAFMNLSEKTCFRLLNAPFFIPHENWKNQEFVKWAWISKDKYWNCWKKGAFKL